MHCIISPNVLKRLAQDTTDPAMNEILTRTLVISASLRGQREMLGAMRSIMPSLVMSQKHRTIYTANNKQLNMNQLPGKQLLDENQPLKPTTNLAVKEAFEGLGKTYDFYKSVFNRNSVDGKGLRLVATVHFGKNFNNAFWNGQEMIFGDGDGKLFTSFTGAVDVIGHELTHGVTQFTADLDYHNQSGALNESFSDVFGSLIKQYPNQTVDKADWLIGDGILGPIAKTHAKALRSMADPKAGLDPQPAKMSEYQDLPDDEMDDYGGVHVNSGIPNHAFYLVATQLGGKAWEKAGAIWYNTLLRLRHNSQFADCANTSAQVAAALYGSGSNEHKAVIGAWKAVEVPVAAPSPTIATIEDVGAAPLHVSMADLKTQLEQTASQIENIISKLP